MEEQIHDNTKLLVFMSSLCLLVTNSVGSQCAGSLSYPPSEQLSLCTSRRLTLTKLAILPDNDCTCQLTISVHDRVRIAAKFDSSQTPDCAREAFVVSNLATSVNTRPLCEMGACEELGSPTERSVYVLSYRSELASTETSLRLWLEVLPDPITEQIKQGVTLQCGLAPLQNTSGPVKLNKEPTSYWSVPSSAGLSSGEASSSVEPTGRSTVPVTSKPSGLTSPSLPGNEKSSSPAGALHTASRAAINATDSTTTSTRNVSDVTKPTSDVKSDGFWSNVLQHSEFVISLSIALTLAVIIMVVTGAISYMMFRKKRRQRSGSGRRILRRNRRRSEDNSSEGEKADRSDYGSVFRVSGTNTNDIRFQY